MSRVSNTDDARVCHEGAYSHHISKLTTGTAGGDRFTDELLTLVDRVNKVSDYSIHVTRRAMSCDLKQSTIEFHHTMVHM